MKILIAGAFGKLGSDLVRVAVRKGYNVVAAGRTIRDIDGLDVSQYEVKQMDVLKKESLAGICDNIDIVITTVGLTKASKVFSSYDLDYQGNKYILEEAIKSKVKKFVYISVIKAEQGEGVPMVHAKYLMEEEIKKSGISYVIHRPTGYFYDIANVFMPMIEKGKVSLLGKDAIYANVIDTWDLAEYIIEHIKDENETYEVGGKVSYSYEEMAKMFFEAAGKPVNISYVPAWLFDVLTKVNKWKGNGKESFIKFSKWTLTNDMVGGVKYGEKDFKEYVKDCYDKRRK